MSKTSPLSAACFCGSVEFVVSGAPVAAGFCHCASCRHWSAAPVNAFALWSPDSVQVTRGAEHIGSYARTARSLRKWCTRCGGHLFTEHPGMGVIDVYAALLPELPFAPALHVHYAESVLHLHDGRPKFQDMPKEMGGSGVLLPE
jgi:hypothetical protein